MEKQVESRLRQEIVKRGGKCYKWVAPGTRGVADRTIYMPYGFHYIVECKFGDKGQLSVHQLARKRELELLGTKTWIVKDDETLKEFLTQVDKDQKYYEI